MDEHEFERTALKIQERILTMTDAEIRASYEASDVEAGDPWQKALAQAMKDRDIDD